MTLPIEADWLLGIVAELWVWFVLAISVASGAWMAWRRTYLGHLPDGRRGPSPQHAVRFAIGLMGLLVGLDAVRGVCGLRHLSPLPLSWVSWGGLAAATAVCLRGRAAAFYTVAAIGVGVAWIQRAYWPGRFFVWGAVCDLAGFALVTALAGWGLPRLATRWQHRELSTRPDGGWFCMAQAVWIACTAALTAWIALDFGFDRMGQQVALFGLAGRAAGSAAALMLLGAAILMAWQTSGAWRGAWQYAALAAGVLLTSSLGWSQLDPAALVSGGTSAWLKRSESLMISAGMMTSMTGWGLARILPAGSDWIARGRQAMPYFAGLTALMLGLVLLQRMTPLGTR